MSETRGIQGRKLAIEAPEWEPLIDLAAAHVDDFTWMHAIELEDGTEVQAYKHRWSSSHLLLASGKRAFVEIVDGRYREVGGDAALLELFEDEVAEFGYYFVPQNDPQAIQLKWARSATRHRISRPRSRHVIEHCGGRFRAGKSDDGHRDPRVLFLGDDAGGVALEVVAVETGREAFLVIHAMELRQKYRALYERGRRWRRK